MQHGLEPRWRAIVCGGIVAASLACSGGCEREDATSAASAGARPPATAPTADEPRAEPVPPPPLPAAVANEGADAGASDGGVPTYAGPHFTVTLGSTGIYAEPSPDRSLKIGYARSGGRVPVLPGTL